VKSIYKNFVRMGGVIAPLASVLAISTPVQAATLTTFASGFSNPTGIAFDRSGNLFVANNSSSITKVSGGTQSTFATGLNNPSDLAFSPSGNLYVADTFNNRIKGFSPAGSLIFNTNSFLNQPRGLAFDPSGNLFVTNTGQGNLAFFTNDGSGNLNPTNSNPTGKVDALAIAVYQDFNSSGVLSQGESTSRAFIGAGGNVVKSIESLLIDSVGLPESSIVLDLVYDDVDRKLYFSDFANNAIFEIKRINPVLRRVTLSTLISSGLNQPSYLAINGNNLYISDNGSGNILEFQLRTTPIPFEFNPTLGIGILGSVWLVRKRLKKKV
jgi:hypothetical protein